MRLCRLGPSLFGALASADVRREVVSGLLRLPRLSLSRHVRFTNRFTELVTDLPVCYPSRHDAHARTCLFFPLPSAHPREAHEIPWVKVEPPGGLIRTSGYIVQDRPLLAYAGPIFHTCRCLSGIA
jgi:hypothetical protein